MASVLTTVCIPLFSTLCTSFRISLYLISLFLFLNAYYTIIGVVCYSKCSISHIFVRVQPVFFSFYEVDSYL